MLVPGVILAFSVCSAVRLKLSADLQPDNLNVCLSFSSTVNWFLNAVLCGSSAKTLIDKQIIYRAAGTTRMSPDTGPERWAWWLWEKCGQRYTFSCQCQVSARFTLKGQFTKQLWHFSMCYFKTLSFSHTPTVHLNHTQCVLVLFWFFQCLHASFLWIL